MTKITKLNIGDTVASGGGKCFRSLRTKSICGTWMFNETLFGDTERIAANIAFISNETSFVQMRVSYFNSGNQVGQNICLNYFRDSDETVIDAPNAYYFIEYDGNTVGWTNNAYRLVDFGTEPQYISEKFYGWFTANATKIA